MSYWSDSGRRAHGLGSVAAGRAFGGDGGRVVTGFKFRPAGGMMVDDVDQCLDMSGSVVQGREVAITFAAGLQERPAVFDGDFL